MDEGTNLYLQYLHGDKQALDRLVVMYSDGLTRFAYSFVQDGNAAEDIMENTFAVLLVRRHWVPKVGLQAYLYRIARNKCIDYLRLHRKCVRLDDLAEVAAFEDVADSVVRQEKYRTLYRCMQDLPLQYRQVLYLRYMEDFDPQAIAKVLKRNVKQVYNLLSRAKAALKQRLNEEGITE